MQQAENINPAILKWARETAGLTLERAASKIGLHESNRSRAAEKLMALETGEIWPTRQQLIKIASVYHRPLIIFYLSKSPQPDKRETDFRKLGEPVSDEETGLLDALLRNIHARQGMVKAILEDDDDIQPLPFVGSLSLETPFKEAVTWIEKLLNIDDREALARKHSNADNLFNDLRGRIEQIGIFVVLAGNFGTPHTNISARVFRGFAIADKIAPFIVINDQDAKAARSFTLMHELAHILNDSSGISAAPHKINDDKSHAPVERFCNDVAGHFLLPDRALTATPALTRDNADKEIAGIAKHYNVSESMVAYRLWRSGKLDDPLYLQIHRQFEERWQESQKRKREKKQSGGNYYTTRKHRLGNALLGVVDRALRSNELTYTKAATVLGVPPSSVKPLIQHAFESERR